MAPRAGQGRPDRIRTGPVLLSYPPARGRRKKPGWQEIISFASITSATSSPTARATRLVASAVWGRRTQNSQAFPLSSTGTRHAIALRSLRVASSPPNPSERRGAFGEGHPVAEAGQVRLRKRQARQPWRASWSERLTSAYKMGSTIRVAMVEVTMPPTTTVARGR